MITVETKRVVIKLIVLFCVGILLSISRACGICSYVILCNLFTFLFTSFGSFYKIFGRVSAQYISSPRKQLVYLQSLFVHFTL